jgi:hypothetical protein
MKLFAEQQEIVRRGESMFMLPDQIGALLAAAQRQVDALTPSLPPSRCYGGIGLASAFKGKL